MKKTTSTTTKEYVFDLDTITQQPTTTTTTQQPTTTTTTQQPTTTTTLSEDELHDNRFQEFVSIMTQYSEPFQNEIDKFNDKKTSIQNDITNTINELVHEPLNCGSYENINTITNVINSKYKMMMEFSDKNSTKCEFPADDIFSGATFMRLYGEPIRFPYSNSKEQEFVSKTLVPMVHNLNLKYEPLNEMELIVIGVLKLGERLSDVYKRIDIISSKTYTPDTISDADAEYYKLMKEKRNMEKELMELLEPYIKLQQQKEVTISTEVEN
jgi:hypothetical protein